MACQRCGKCCREVSVPVPDPLTIDALRWVQLHGGTVGRDGGKAVGLIPARCHVLGMDGHTCTIYADRPACCQMYLCDEARR